MFSAATVRFGAIGIRSCARLCLESRPWERRLLTAPHRGQGTGMAFPSPSEDIVVERQGVFQVTLKAEEEPIGQGTREWAIINVARFAARLAEKRQQKLS
jgi:hypothetical protein